MHFFVRGSTILLLLGDIGTFVLSLVLTLLIRYQAIPDEKIIEQHLQPFVFLFCIWVLMYLITGLYDRHVSFVRKKIPSLVIKVQSINILIAALVFFMLPLEIAPKLNLIIYLVISTALIALWRLFLFPRITTGKPSNVLVVGDSEEATAIARVLARNPYFKNVNPFLLSKADISEFTEFRAALFRFVANEQCDMIVADMRDPYATKLTKDFYTLAFEHQNIQFFDLLSMYEQLHHRVPPELVKETWLLENITTGTPHYAYDFLKRCIDVFGSLVLLLPSLLVFPFVILAIKLDDGGPLFYKAERIGQFNRVIHIYKFRTMTGRDEGSAALRSELVVTRAGRILRKTRLDELPQLFNVLRGDLSFVGPRPEIPALAHVYAEQIPHYNLRHHIKPGLSGWAQINNFDVPRGGVDIPRTIDKLSFDLYYLKRRSLLLDIEIALKTVNILVMRTGT